MNGRRPIARTALSVTLAVVVGAFVAGWTYYERTYPYGWSHCCIIQMMMGFKMYANDNGGRYPAGEATAEASLGLLLRSNYVDPDTLRGMTVPLETVRRRLEEHKPLDADSCGWQYIEGLTEADDPEIAMLYCKQALGHNGQRTKDGGRQVVFVDTEIRWVSGQEWPSFLEKQRQRLSKRTEPEKAGQLVVDAVIELPDGTRINTENGPYTLRQQEKDINGYTDDRTESGKAVVHELGWFQVPVRIDFTGSVVRTLSFSNLVSDPVTVNFILGRPDCTNVVFKMKKKD
jgi:hypothetical protein